VPVHVGDLQFALVDGGVRGGHGGIRERVLSVTHTAARSQISLSSRYASVLK
jgi:hypothetical protein